MCHETVTVLAAGDIAACSKRRDGGEATACLLDREPGVIVALGDTVQRAGAPQDYRCYDRTWGRHKARTYPVIGNHECNTDQGKPYWVYWGEQAGTPGDGWYSVDLSPHWHLIVLNSQAKGARMARQLVWLEEVLAATSASGVLAAFHHPLLSDATRTPSGRDERVEPLWERLYAAGASIVLCGHRHVYERFAPLDPMGVLAPERGLRQFVVGTGGYNHHAFQHQLTASRARDNTTFGVLRLVLAPGAYTWEFVPVAGGTFTDAGAGLVVRQPLLRDNLVPAFA
jgi:3',5'-cyclic AMP phosphodiesterase CpdA